MMCLNRPTRIGCHGNCLDLDPLFNVNYSCRRIASKKRYFSSNPPKEGV